ncbi:MAG: hypothetical protein LBS60_12120 [Deltaproteobacteria bacterium]|nr:hypothetical protein [Deltaproteobacteria bacterium]
MGRGKIFPTRKIRLEPVRPFLSPLRPYLDDNLALNPRFSPAKGAFLPL